jgi:hypothetical protein
VDEGCDDESATKRKCDFAVSLAADGAFPMAATRHSSPNTTPPRSHITPPLATIICLLHALHTFNPVDIFRPSSTPKCRCFCVTASGYSEERTTVRHVNALAQCHLLKVLETDCLADTHTPAGFPEAHLDLPQCQVLLRPLTADPFCEYGSDSSSEICLSSG